MVSCRAGTQIMDDGVDFDESMIESAKHVRTEGEHSGILWILL